MTADHKVLNEGGESRNNHRYADVVQDLATQWMQYCPCETKTSQEAEKSLRKFLEPSAKQKIFCSDSSLECGKSCEDSSWNHPTSTPHRSETNIIAERAVRAVKEGTSAVLLQSGLDEKWWADSVECYCHLRIVQDLQTDGKTPCERRFGNHSTVQKFLLEHSLNIIRFLHETSPDYTNLERKFYLENSLDMRLKKYGEDRRVRNPCSKAQRKRSINASKGRHFSQMQMVQQNCWEETMNFENRL